MRNVEEIKDDLVKHEEMRRGEPLPYPLDPEQLDADIKCLHKELLCALTAGIPLSRLEAICASEREGNCVLLPWKRGNRIYVLREEWERKYHKNNIHCTRLNRYLIYNDEIERSILIKCTANEKWHDIKNVFATRGEAKAELARAEVATEARS